MRERTLPSAILKKLSSSTLALVLIIVLILFSIAGAVLPQQGKQEILDISLWQQAHPLVTAVMEPVGFFRVFNSWPFLITVFILGVNTLACTLLRFVERGGFASFRGPGAIRRLGSFSFHICLILLFTGGILTSATRMKARIVLTEGQTFKESHDNYRQLVEGLFRPERHTDALIGLKKVQIKYEQKRYPIDVTSDIEIQAAGEEPVTGQVKVNQPVIYNNLVFTQDKTGFSPRLKIRYKKSGMFIMDSFVALKTSETPEGKVYRDYLELPFIKERIIVTLYPSFLIDNLKVRKTGDEPENPLLLIEIRDEVEQVTLQGRVPLGGKINLGAYAFFFADLRRWSALMVVEDPGYQLVCISLWLGLAALVIRYVPDLKKWFGNGTAGRGRPVERRQGLGG